MEILILGFVLFIFGVSATIVYDKYKDKATAAFKAQQERTAIRKEAEAKFAAAQAATTASKKKSQEEVVNELLRERAARKANPGPFTQSSMEEEFLTRFNEYIAKVQRPGAYNHIKAGPVKEGDIPTETLYNRELFNDVSINSKLTVQELIEKIERMKKR